MSTLRLPRHAKRLRGQSLVEFALTLPIFMLFVLGIIETGRAVYTRAATNFAAEAGARKAALNPPFSETDVKNAALAAAPDGLIVGNITVTAYDDVPTLKTFTSRVAGDRVRVDISRSYTPVPRMVFPLFPSFTFTARAEREVE